MHGQKNIKLHEQHPMKCDMQQECTSMHYGVPHWSGVHLSLIWSYCCTKSFVFQFATPIYEDYTTHNYNFACCFVWV